MKPGKGRFVLSLILFAAVASVAPISRQQAQTPRKKLAISPDQIQRALKDPSQPQTTAADGHFIVKTATGAACRHMTPDEAARMRIDAPRTNLHSLSGTDPSVMQQGFTITLRGTQQLENFPAAKAAFQRAAAKWQAIIQDPVTVPIDVDFGPNRFGTPYDSPNTIGATSDPVVSIQNQYEVLRNLLVGGADGPVQATGYGLIPPNSLPTDLGNTMNVRVTTPQLRTLGITNVPGDPAIGFNSAFAFDFDPTDGIDPDKIDFEGVAIHEIGHALGFSSSVGLKELIPTVPNIPSLWDYFRFRPGGLAVGSVRNQTRLQLVGGGLQNFFAGFEEYELSTGGPDGNGGDMEQSSHWRDDFFSGRYVGVMDPTASEGQGLFLTAADISTINLLLYSINPDVTVTELPSVDDNSREENVTLTNAMVVNRFALTRFPSTLQGIRLQIPAAVTVGQSIRVVAFLDPNRTGQPPANPTFIADRTLTLGTIPRNRFLDILLSNVPAITAGDLYLGIQSASTVIGVDTNGVQRRASFISTNNGASFTLLQGASNTPANFIARAILTNRYGAAVSPAPETLSPSAVSPGSGEFTLVVRGNGFRQNSVVRFNNVDRPTTYNSAGELRAQIPASDVASAGTPKVTVFTAGAGESAGLNFTVGGDAPAPTVARLSPAAAPVGASATTVNVFGTNFTANSVIRLNGNALATTRTDSTQLSAQLPASALTAAGDQKISVSTPGPGGGTTTDLNFSVIACAFSVPTAVDVIPSAGGSSGFVLTTSSVCNWTAAADQSWITISSPTAAAGTGKFVIGYTAAANTAAAQRMAMIGVGGQQFSIRQLGRATGVSAASFTAIGGFAPDSIAALFGQGLAASTAAASTTPLPTTLNGARVVLLNASTGAQVLAPLFFVSPGQINFLIPAGTAAGNYRVIAQVNGGSVADGAVSVSAVAPGLFSQNASGQGIAAAVALRVKADGTQIFEPIARFDQAQNRFVPVPIDLGPEGEKVFAILYGTGVRGRTGLGGVSLRIGDAASTVTFAGASPGFIGLDQINAEIPRSLIGKGDVNVVMTIDAKAANTVSLNIK